MKLWHFLLTLFLAFPIRNCALASPIPDPSRWRPIPKASSEAAEKLKKAFAAYSQGHYDRAIHLARDVYQQEGNVRARWWQSWIFRYAAREQLPDPYDFDAIREMWVEGKGHLAVGARGARPLFILALSYLELGNYEEALSWAKLLGGQILYDAQELYRRRGPSAQHGKLVPSKHTWRPLPLRYREEDYFILVPLDDACRVLAIPYRLDISPKTKRVRYVFLGEQGKLLPGLTQARNTKGERDHLAYAPYEEDGVVWVPFYWLAKQVGIKGWEVRNGKIYVAPTNEGTVPPRSAKRKSRHPRTAR